LQLRARQHEEGGIERRVCLADGLQQHAPVLRRIGHGGVKSQGADQGREAQPPRCAHGEQDHAHGQDHGLARLAGACRPEVHEQAWHAEGHRSHGRPDQAVAGAVTERQRSFAAAYQRQHRGHGAEGDEHEHVVHGQQRQQTGGEGAAGVVLVQHHQRRRRCRFHGDHSQEERDREWLPGGKYPQGDQDEGAQRLEQCDADDAGPDLAELGRLEDGSDAEEDQAERYFAQEAECLQVVV
jgi:hypothetical protein